MDNHMSAVRILSDYVSHYVFSGGQIISHNQYPHVPLISNVAPISHIAT